MTHTPQTPRSVSEHGQAIALFVIMLAVLFGGVALAVDGGRLYYSRRTVQNAADNAALAAAYALCTSSDENSAALNSAASNGFDNNGTTNLVVINHPPSAGVNTGDDAYVEVLVNSQEDTAFAQLFYDGDFETTARAVGHCADASGPIGGGNGLIALADTGTCTFNSSGSGGTVVLDGGVFVNSSGDPAFCISGGSTGPGGAPRVQGEWINVVGGVNVPFWIDVEPDTPTTGVPPMSDPLAALDPPPHPGGACTNFNQGNHWWTPEIAIDPGLYCGINITSDANIRMNPGVYYIEGGNFAVNGDADLIANGVFIYVESGSVWVGGSGDVTITAPASGPWQGLAFFMGRDNTSNYTIDGDGDISVSGTIYGPDASVVIGGSGTSTSFTSQFIAWDYNVSGSGLIQLTYDPDLAFQFGGGGALVQLAE